MHSQSVGARVGANSAILRELERVVSSTRRSLSNEGVQQLAVELAPAFTLSGDGFLMARSDQPEAVRAANRHAPDIASAIGQLAARRCSDRGERTLAELSARGIGAEALFDDDDDGDALWPTGAQ